VCCYLTTLHALHSEYCLLQPASMSTWTFNQGRRRSTVQSIR
jgi:hypothetical protein